MQTRACGPVMIHTADLLGGGVGCTRMVRQALFWIAFLFCLTPFASPPLALVIGLVIAFTVGHPYHELNTKATGMLLKVSVVGLGFGMNVDNALATSAEGLGYTVATIVVTLLLGMLLGRWLGVDRNTAFLVASGTAICGGSAIAAVAPIVKADEQRITVALGTVFMLNAVALFLFPWIGHRLALSQQDFGLWAAIAIHDTSSVVGAASSYGDEALRVATTVKLARALWIIPLALASALFFRVKGAKVSIPWFIGLFLIAMVLNTYVPLVRAHGPALVDVAKHGLMLTLFLIGSSLSSTLLRAVGIRPFLQGALLWILVSAGTLLALLYT